jgi:transcriptional regulator with XRE-family HTH domain
MKSKNYKVETGFEDLFTISDKEEKIEHRAQMISYRILSEVEKICEEKNINMKELAKLVDTSASYVTQLFRGYRQVNTMFMAKFEEAMKMFFEFSVKLEKEQHDENFRMQMTADKLTQLRNINPGYNFYYVQPGGCVNKTEQYLAKMQQDLKTSGQQINKQAV